MERFGLDSYEEKRDITEKAKRICDFICKSDYDFYKEIREETSKEEFEEFCREFPDARIVLNKVK